MVMYVNPMILSYQIRGIVVHRWYPAASYWPTSSSNPLRHKPDFLNFLVMNNIYQREMDDGIIPFTD